MGPDTVMYIALENMVFICDESHGIQSYTGSNTKSKNLLQFQIEKKKASKTREEERSFVILTGCLRLFFYPPPPVVCPLSLGEMQKSALWGEAASSLQLHLGGLCECQ